MTELIQIMSKDNDSSPDLFKGVFSGWETVGGIVLIIVGILCVYFGIKVIMGYRFFPEQNATIVEEDKYIPIKAKVLQKHKTTMPDFNGSGEREIVDWKIGYEIDGEKHTQYIPDDGYEKGMLIDIKYNPENPDEYYLDDEKTQDETEKAEPEQKHGGPTGVIVIALGVMLAVLGIILLL